MASQKQGHELGEALLAPGISVSKCIWLQRSGKGDSREEHRKGESGTSSKARNLKRKR